MSYDFETIFDFVIAILVFSVKLGAILSGLLSLLMMVVLLFKIIF